MKTSVFWFLIWFYSVNAPTMSSCKYLVVLFRFLHFINRHCCNWICLYYKFPSLVIWVWKFKVSSKNFISAALTTRLIFPVSALSQEATYDYVFGGPLDSQALSSTLKLTSPPIRLRSDGKCRPVLALCFANRSKFQKFI